MMPRRFPHPATSGLLALLAGCAAPTVAPDLDAAGMPNVEVALQRSLDRVDRTMGQLGQYGSTGPLRPVAPAELQRLVSLAWSGPLDEGVKTLADRIGYRFVVTAPSAATPIQVAVNMTDVPVIDVLQALGATGNNATVVVDPDQHLVEVQHHV
jgi:defect-in-organelle-trafficking protein DotD